MRQRPAREVDAWAESRTASHPEATQRYNNEKESANLGHGIEGIHMEQLLAVVEEVLRKFQLKNHG